MYTTLFGRATRALDSLMRGNTIAEATFLPAHFAFCVQMFCLGPSIHIPMISVHIVRSRASRWLAQATIAIVSGQRTASA